MLISNVNTYLINSFIGLKFVIVIKHHKLFTTFFFFRPKKGTSYHWDLFVIAAINSVMSVLCFPLVHAVLMHSTLHVLALADVEERVIRGCVQRM